MSSKTVSSRNRLIVFKRDKYTCVHCKKSPATHENCELSIDHVLPISRGGSYDLSNYQTLCVSCNIKKNHRTEQELKEKTLKIYYPKQAGTDREIRLNKGLCIIHGTPLRFLSHHDGIYFYKCGRNSCNVIILWDGFKYHINPNQEYLMMGLFSYIK